MLKLCELKYLIRCSFLVYFETPRISQFLQDSLHFRIEKNIQIEWIMASERKTYHSIFNIRY